MSKWGGNFKSQFHKKTHKKLQFFGLQLPLEFWVFIVLFVVVYFNTSFKGYAVFVECPLGAHGNWGYKMEQLFDFLKFLLNFKGINDAPGGAKTPPVTGSEARGGQTSAPSSVASSMSRKPKASSFQITSVTLGTRTSADNGEDSADDLDESHSHTDDNSRVTDHGNETPSFSEDTSFSKEDVYYSSNALGTAPVIPTSSQYGLAIVSPELNGTATLTDVHVSLTDAGINIVGNAKQNCDVDIKDVHQRNERFKVVKIESTEPFKRGRWMCMDYLDHTTLQQANAGSEGALDGTDEGVAKVNNILPGQTAPAVFYNSTVVASQAAPTETTTTVPEVTSPPAVNATTNTSAAYTAQSMPSHQIQEAISAATKRPPKVSSRHQGQTQPSQYYQQALKRHSSTQEYTQGATLPAHLLNFRDTAGLEASLASLSSGHPIEQHHNKSPKRQVAQTPEDAAVTPSSQPEVDSRVKEPEEVVTPCDRVATVAAAAAAAAAPEAVDSNCVSTSSGVNSPTVSVVSQPDATPDATTEVDMTPEQQQHLGATPGSNDENAPTDDSEK